MLYNRGKSRRYLATSARFRGWSTGGKLQIVEAGKDSKRHQEIHKRYSDVSDATDAHTIHWDGNCFCFLMSEIVLWRNWPHIQNIHTLKHSHHDSYAFTA